MSRSALPFDDTHIFRMTDDTGMLQHARFGIPDLLEGYTTDDNARALLMAVMLYEQQQKSAYLALVYRYLGFVLYAQNEAGRFRNFMTYGRQFTEKEGSEDCFGRCLWALGYTQASSAMPSGIKEACRLAVNRALPNIQSLVWLRGQAYTMIGLSFIDNPVSDHLISELADMLSNRFEDNAGDKNWPWFEDNLTYDNAVLPWALYIAYRRLGQERLLCAARKSLSFLDLITFRDECFHPVGCNGWLVRGGEPAPYDEQPLEACTATLAHLAAYDATGDASMLELAQKSFAWYLGENSRHECLIDTETGGCCDGIIPDGLNRNQGAESIVSYSIARLSLAKYETDGGSGLKDLLTMRTNDIILAAKNDESRKVKDLVERLKANDRVEPDEYTTVYRPWGLYTVLSAEPGYKLKKIVVNPGQALSLQMHYYRSEHWIIISGTAKVVIGDTESTVHENESVFVAQTAKHRIENPGRLPLEIIEVQKGSYLGEDDIVRFEDKYGRI